MNVSEAEKRSVQELILAPTFIRKCRNTKSLLLLGVVVVVIIRHLREQYQLGDWTGVDYPCDVNVC